MSTKRNILGVWVDALDYETAVSTIINAAKENRPLSVTALAVHGVMTGVLDNTHRYRLNKLDLVTPDGQPVRWGLNWLHSAALADRVYGPTLMLKVCEQAAQENLPICLYGSQNEVIEILSKELTARFPNLIIAKILPSKFRQLSQNENITTIQEIRASGAAITFVGLGCPRQEVWVYENSTLLSMPAIAVGAAFDFHAGLSSQAPGYLQEYGLEWLFRFWHEPKRLWKRYVLLNPTYLLLLLLQMLKLKRFEPQTAPPPVKELYYG